MGVSIQKSDDFDFETVFHISSLISQLGYGADFGKGFGF
jgi:hypothetical protein